MTEYYDLSDVKMPENTTCLPNIISNKVNHSYELSISLFDKCQLHCDFCFQTHKKDIDLDYIYSIPEKIMEIVPRLIKYKTETLFVRIWGGELFHDGIKDEMFDVYQDIITQIKKNFLEALPHLKIKINFVSNGVWTKHREKVLKLLNDNNAIMCFSYDPVGRFPNEQSRQLMIDNVHYFYDKNIYTIVALTLTKRNIEYIIDGKDDFINNFPKTIPLDINSYIPGNDWKINLPNDELLTKFWLYILKHQMFNCQSLLTYIDPILYPNHALNSTCCCKCSDQFSNGCLVRDCIKRTSVLPRSDFYGDLDKDLTDNNVQEVKNYLGTIKRGCLYCENLNRCSWMCFSSILYKEYQATSCPINNLLNYTKKNIEEIKQQLIDFDKTYNLSKIFYNPYVEE